MKTVLNIPTPLGDMTLVEEGAKLSELRLKAHVKDGERMQSTPLLRKAAQQLTEYFAGKRKAFTVPLTAEGTTFQRAVWDALTKIPYGQTLSYGGVAANIGRPKAARAVGMANHNNPLPIFIPCHRVIGRDGKMVGYGGGIDVKEYLLRLETA